MSDARRTMTRNAAASVLQVALSAVTLFALYRLVVGRIGIERMAVWSLVLSATTTAAIVRLGAGPTVVRYVARFAVGSNHNLLPAVQTAYVLTFGLVGGILLLAWPVADRLLARVIDDPLLLAEGRAILPVTLFAAWLIAGAGVHQSALDGLQRMTARSAAVCSGLLLNFAICVSLIDRLGLQAVALGQVAQGACSLAIGCLLLRRHLPGVSLAPRGFDRRSFAEMKEHTLGMQAATVAETLLGPAARFLTAEFGGLALAALLDLALRVVLHLSWFLIEASRAALPVISSLHEHDLADLAQLYRRLSRTLAYVSWPVFAAAVVAAPSLSLLLLGRPEPALTLVMAVVAAGWLTKTLAYPSYLVLVGTGAVTPVWRSHCAGLLVLLACGTLAGWGYGGAGILAAYAAAVAVSGGLLRPACSRLLGRRLVPEVRARPLFLIAVCCVGPAGVLALGEKVVHDTHYGRFAPTVWLAGWCLLVALALWWHPERRALVSLLPGRTTVSAALP